MKIILFTHPHFIGSQSMPRFANMITHAMQERSHTIESWTAHPVTYRIPCPSRFKKWLGYIDQFLIFPLKIRKRIKKLPNDTLFVFADQALGPWVPLAANRPHVIHVHDFMALRSALGELPQNPTSWTGRIYQKFIRRGFGKGKNFLSVSKKTQIDLHRFLPKQPELSETIYNGLNFPYYPMKPSEIKSEISKSKIELPESGFLLHVGGNQWYKNRLGVLEIYAAYTKKTNSHLPLLMIGPPPTEKMKKIADSLNNKIEIKFLTGLSNEQLRAAYSSANLLIFPSLAEGFGWPIAEAMACGCPVLTTAEAPMTEVGGDAAHYIPIRPQNPADIETWANHAAQKVMEILDSPQEEKTQQRERCLTHAASFNTRNTLEAYEQFYLKVLETHR